MGFLKDKLVNARRKHLNVEDWMGWSQVKQNAEQIKKASEGVDFRIKKEKSYDDFSTWMRSLSLTEKDLPAFLSKAKKVALAFLGFGVALFIYSAYLFIVHDKILGIYTVLMSFLLLAHALKQWKLWVLVSMKQGKCSFKKMVQFTLGSRS